MVPTNSKKINIKYGGRIMPCYAIKTQQIEKETAEYSNYDWELFSNLTFEEKVAEYLKISEILLMRKRSKHHYFQLTPKLHENEDKTRLKRVGGKILRLGKLINILECVINQMEWQIVLLK